MTNPALAEPPRFTSGKIIKVDVAGSPYEIVIGHSILSEAGTLIRVRLGARRCVIVTDTNIEPLYRARLEAVLTTSGHDVRGCFVVPAGESSKDFAHLQTMIERMLTSGVDRKTLIVALGGGVVGDLAGLAASLVLRGLDLVQIPTTLLAQVDSSVGGKTAIDTSHGKNTVGSFYQPKLVIADVTLLDSLPAREMRAGYAETVKYGLISDPMFFRWCLAHGGQLLNGEHDMQVAAVATSCAAKAKIVAADERETDADHRALLNFGHTFGHALESVTGYGNLLVHGEAVAIGMIMALRLSVKMGLCPQADYDEARAHFVSVGLPVTPPPFTYDIDRLMEFMTQDKKAIAGKLTLILVRGIGNAFVSRDCDSQQIREVWKEFIAS